MRFPESPCGAAYWQNPREGTPEEAARKDAFALSYIQHLQQQGNCPAGLSAVGIRLAAKGAAKPIPQPQE